MAVASRHHLVASIASEVLVMVQVRMPPPTHAHELDEAIATRIHAFDRRVLVRAHDEIPGQKSVIVNRPRD